MTQVNMFEAKSELSKLVKLLETKQEDEIYLARNGVPVVKLTLINKPSSSVKIGTLKGKLKVSDKFEEYDKEIEGMFNL